MSQKTPRPNTSSHAMTVLSRLLLSPGDSELFAGSYRAVANISRDRFEDLVELANTNHVIVRGLEVLRVMMRDARDEVRAKWVDDALAAECRRIDNAISFLGAICEVFTEEGHDVTVIKSLDHWPDLGSDLDLYTNANPEEISALMRRSFQAQIAQRSWGDRLACKWNFLIPGLPEAVEIHIGRLGQTGEQVSIASRLNARARPVTIGNHTFRVPAVSDRLLISVLQRMYRHFYFRLCDMVDTATLYISAAIDYDGLRASAKSAGIWEGVSAYLVIVSNYLKQYQHSGLDLPPCVTGTAKFDAGEVYFERGFLRVPIMPLPLRLYSSQLAGLLRRRELQSTARLGLLPWLATAAVVGQKITGSDKGIW
jgi:hypothetical protein